MTEIISITLLDFNKGQLAGLPKNPRFSVIIAMRR